MTSRQLCPTLARSAFLPAVLLLTANLSFSQAPAPTLDSEQLAFLTTTNNYRVQNGVGPLQASTALENSSQWMSTDMAAKNYFSHTDSLGRDPFTRMAAFNYSYKPAGENIAAGYSDAQNTFNQWVTACDSESAVRITPRPLTNGIGRRTSAAIWTPR